MSKQFNIYTTHKSSHFLKLIFYWLVALIPLTWGIIMTIYKAMALF
ncbi:MAG TPA: hypothetical protein VN763_14880 [Saprospiraceae bacterium]|nr:hypothetical protein [Saprospiraceae bacterium]HZV43786.1 hypothetical protein [Saprospiraceae bacterium]